MNFARVEFEFRGRRWRMTLDGESSSLTTVECYSPSAGRWLHDPNGLTDMAKRHMLLEFMSLAASSAEKFDGDA